MTTHRIAGISVKAPDGNVIGKAVLEVDEGGNVRAHMTLDSVLGRELITSMEAGIVEGLSFGPVITPAVQAEIDHPHIADFDLDPKNRSVGEKEIRNRFGFHKATLEGPNASAPRHAYLRNEFSYFADMLDRVLPSGRYKSLAFIALEEASMWSHKAIANQAPIATD